MMYSLLVGIALDDRPDPAILKRACRITRLLMPTLGSAVREYRTELPEVGGGWFYFLPHPPPMRPLVSEFTGADARVLCFGGLDEAGDRAPAAKLVHRAWSSGSVEAVRRLAGSYSAVIVDRANPAVHVIGDPLGRRTLRYLPLDRTLLISNHDLPIAATGLCPLEFDLFSAASILSWGWSLAGAPLLQRLRTCQPNGHLRWCQGDARWIDHDAFPLGERVNPRDRSVRRALTNQMTAAVRRNVRERCTGSDAIRADLTAGLDSRAALAVLLGCVPPDRITVATAGDPEHLDVRVAARIAGHYGIRHERLTPPRPTTDAFFQNCDVLAYFMNGATNSKRGLGQPLHYDPRAPRLVGGGGGEIFRGVYYRYRYAGPAGNLNADDARRLLHFHRRTSPRTPWLDDVFPAEVEKRLDHVIETYAVQTRSGHDILDLFYLRERFGRWAAGARMPQHENHYSPFENAAAIRAAFRLPAPIGSHCDLHRELIRSSLPRAYWIPVNGRTLLPLPAGLNRWVGRLRARLIGCYPRRSSGTAARSIETLQSELLSGALGRAIKDQLLAGDAFGVALFGTANLRTLIDAHLAGTQDHMQVLGFLITLERWQRLIRRAAALARE